ncbi:MAG: type IV pilus assembly protein PilM [Candidatus Staskawiczbacteria bacterium]|nr:type IV pilus assembly protein PilM [Candidatus Staskawiczbacteria bacterium]
MPKFLNLEPEIFGVDINDSSLKIAKLKKKPKGFSLVSFNEVKIRTGILKEGIIQDEKALANIIKMACLTVKGKKLGTKYVIVSLPEEKSFSQLIEVPQMTEKELKLAVPFEAENYIPLAIDKIYLDFQVVNFHHSNQRHLDLLINAMPRFIVDSYVSCFKKAGLTPYILEVESQAIARALLKNGDKILPTIIVDLGRDRTHLIIFSGGSVRFTSSVSTSSQLLTRAISESFDLNLHSAEALKVKQGLNKKGRYDIDKAVDPILKDLALQIKKYIDFYHNHSFHDNSLPDGKIRRVILSGGGANLKNLAGFLTKELGIPIELGNPFLNITLPKKINFPQGSALSFTTVLGLALRGAEEQLNYD